MDGDRDTLRIFIGRRKARAANSGIEFREFIPISYDVDSDMLELADVWSARFRFERALWDWSAPDNPVVIELNRRPVMTGIIDDSKRRLSKEGSLIELNGRDRGARLVDSAAPLVDLTGIGIEDLARLMVTSIGGFDLFPSVSLQNATNRALMTGGARRARVSREPAIRASPDQNDRRVRPGQTRSQVLEEWLTEAALLAWSSADGRQFIVGKPNYSQEPQFDLFAPAHGSRQAARGNVLDLEHTESAGERYSRIIVLGTGGEKAATKHLRALATNFGENVQRRGVARQGPNPDGTGAAFVLPKDLIILDDNLHSQAAAQARAEREMALRESQALQVNCMVLGHSQAMGAEHTRANYAIDTMVRLEDEEIDASGNPREFLITRVQFSGGKMGRTTRLALIPKGVDLRMSGS